MDNKYTYYTSPQENSENSYYYENMPDKKPKKGAPKWIKFLCFALVFGLVAGAAFQVGNAAVGKILGTSATDGGQNVSKIDNTKITANSNSTISSEVADIAEQAMPSAVSITNMSVQQVQSFFGGIQEMESTSVGSGIILAQNDSELLIITNNHVVEGNKTLTVSFIDEESVKAQVKGTDAAKDLAVIAVSLKDIKSSTMEKIKIASLGDSDKLKVGEPVIAIGNALGYGQSVTTGIVSAKDREIYSVDGKLIQTDAAINPGNSGGALLNANGEVIGINTAKAATEMTEGMGYAIPITSVSDVIDSLVNRETRTKLEEGEQGWLGIKGVDVTAESSQMYGMPIGVYISDFTTNGAAKDAGLKKGTVITAIDGITVDSMAALKEQLMYYRPGEKVEITVQTMNGKGSYEESKVEVTLGKN